MKKPYSLIDKKIVDLLEYFADSKHVSCDVHHSLFNKNEENLSSSEQTSDKYHLMYVVNKNIEK